MDRLRTALALERIAATGSFAAAARDLGLSTTAISRWIRDLEADLGVRLLQRTTRKVSLTEVGARYRDRMAPLLREIVDIDDEVRTLRTEPSGRVRLTASVAFGSRVLAAEMVAFQQRFPKVEVDLYLSGRNQDLVAGRFNLGIRMRELPPSSLIARRLGATDAVVCAAPSYLQARSVPRTPGDLEDLDFVVFAGLERRPTLSFARGETEVRPRSRLSVGTIEAVEAALLQGAGFGLLPSYMARPLIREGRLACLRPDHPLPADPVSAVYPARDYLGLKVRVLIDFLAERFADAHWNAERA